MTVLQSERRVGEIGEIRVRALLLELGLLSVVQRGRRDGVEIGRDAGAFFSDLYF